MAHYASGYSHSGKHLDRLAEILEQAAARDFIRHVDGIAGLQYGTAHTARPPSTRTPPNNRPIGADNKNVLLVAERRRPAGLSEIPARVPTGDVSNGRWIVDLPRHQHEVRRLGHKQRISCPHLNIEDRVLPLGDIG